jgi:hypothetical protein
LNRRDLQKISQIRLGEGQALFNVKSFSGAYYLTGYAIECALKASICKQIEQHDFPDKKLANDSHTHDLTKLLNVSGLKPALEESMKGNPALEVNWSIVKDWSEQIRYRHDITETMARDMIEACTSKADGIHAWISKQW